MHLEHAACPYYKIFIAVNTEDTVEDWTSFWLLFCNHQIILLHLLGQTWLAVECVLSSVGDQLAVMKMNSCGSWRKLYSATLSDVEYWTWLTADTIGLVTDHAVFHWVMQEGLICCSVLLMNYYCNNNNNNNNICQCSLNQVMFFVLTILSFCLFVYKQSQEVTETCSSCI